MVANSIDQSIIYYDTPIYSQKSQQRVGQQSHCLIAKTYFAIIAGNLYNTGAFCWDLFFAYCAFQERLYFIDFIPI